MPSRGRHNGVMPRSRAVLAGVAALGLGAGLLAVGGGALAGEPDDRVQAQNGASANGQWSALGAGVNNQVWALAMIDDTLYAGGDFIEASGITVNRIAAWTDDTWKPLGSGVDSRVLSLVVEDAGTDDTLYAGGLFTTASGISVNRVAAWADDTWKPLGTGVAGGIVLSLAMMDDTLFVGGTFHTASDDSVNGIAAWADDTFHPLGSGVQTSRSVFALAANDDTLFVGGSFDTVSGITVNRVAAWADDTWKPLGSGVNGDVRGLTAEGGPLYAGGPFTEASGVTVNRISVWADDTWSALGFGLSSMGDKAPIVTDDTHQLVYAGGAFTRSCPDAACSGDDTVNRIAVYDKRTGKWAPLRSTSGPGVNNEVRALLLDDTSLYVGGDFTDAGGVGAADRIAKWTWLPPSGAGSYTANAGSQVTVTGEGFVGVSAVTIGGVAATVDYAASSETSLQVTVPAGVSGTASIVVTAVGGTATVGTVSTGSGPAPDPGQVPSAPLNVTADAGDASAVVSWQAPASAGSFPVTNYQVVVSPGGRSCLAVAPTLSCTITGLSNGTEYTASVRALNGAGWGAFSSASAPFTPERSVPGPVRDLELVRATAKGVIVMRWLAPVEGPATTYRAGIRRAGEEGYVRVRPDVATTSIRITGLAPGRYWVRVRAGNAAGWGPGVRYPDPIRIPLN